MWPYGCQNRLKWQKLEYRCTTTNLPACNDTIIILKILLLHSVSVITNFVIPKHYKQTGRQKNNTFSSTAGARLTIPTILRMVIEEDRTIFAPPLTFFDPSNSFATRGYWNFKGKCPHRGKMLITWLFVPRKWPNWKLKSCLWTRIKSENFVKIVQTSDLWGGNLWPKFEILTLLGAVFPHFCPNKREIWYGGADLWSASPCQISRLSKQRVATAGRKTYFWTTE